MAVTATESDAQSLGFITPQGYDRISDGDNAINNNARATVDLYRGSKAYANSAAKAAADALRAELNAMPFIWRAGWFQINPQPAAPLRDSATGYYLLPKG